MSFDPYGIEFYPAQINNHDGSLAGRYILALNNVIDVIEEIRSETRKSPKRNKILIMELFLSKDKLENHPVNKRILFRVKGAETATIFCEELYDLVASDDNYSYLRETKLDCNSEVPLY
ncbi:MULTISPECIES: hypothetical protein [Vibrio]|uniref:hypothetical protein n=1 Tax=Vibrio TaxID=662 RepID=UPI001FCC27B2|nr:MULTISPECIES: hypothetical protein [Vibrio]